MFREERTATAFDWSMIGDVAVGRPNLGPFMPVTVYRLMQFTMRDLLIEEFGVERTDQLFSDAGRRAGEQYFLNVMTPQDTIDGFFAEVQRTLKELKVGIFRVETADEARGSFVVTVEEDLDCSGIPICGEQICTYDEGFIAALFEAYAKRPFRVKEIDCWGTGARTCRFTVDPA